MQPIIEHTHTNTHTHTHTITLPVPNVKMYNLNKLCLVHVALGPENKRSEREREDGLFLILETFHSSRPLPKNVDISETVETNDLM